MNRSYPLTAIIVIAVVVMGVACAAPVAAPEPAQPPAEAPATEAPETMAPAAEPEALEELIVGQFGDPVTLDCWDWTAVDELDILQHFSEPLFRFDREGNIHGVIAESWEMVDPTEWILNIRQGVPFQDPQYGEVTAQDVVASLEACFDPEGRALPKQPGVVAEMELEIVDDYTVRVTFPEPGTAALPNVWTYTAISDAEYLDEVGKEFARQPMGTGPFRFVEWAPNERIVGERFDDYWGELPGAKRIVWRIIPDAFTRKSEFLTGGLDVLPFLQADWVAEVDDNPDVRVESVLSARYIMVVLPVGEAPFSDQRVRQALNYAINKQEMVDQLFLGVGATPPHGMVNPIIPEGDPERTIYPYDPDRAQELLDEARADGVEIPPLTLYAPNDRYVLDSEMGEAISGYWRAIGLEVEYIPESRTTLFPRAMGLELTDPYMVGFGNTLLRADYPFNLWIQKRSDPPSRGSYYAQGPDEWDAMISDLASLASGSEESIELARELDAQVVEFAPWVFVINYVDLFGVSNDVEWAPYPFESRYFFDVQPRQ